MLRFQYINFLLLLAVIPLLAVIFFHAVSVKKKIIKKIGDPLLVRQLIKGYSSKAFLIKFLLIVLAFGILIIALANPRSAVGEQKINRDGIDVMLALDVSKSMLAQDIPPTRLDRAKQVLSRLVDKLDNDRIGIVIFAGNAYLQMPLTGDHAAAKMYLSAATTESVPTQGTVISDALKMCNASFNEKEKKYKAVVLISDGEDHDEKAIKTAQVMAASGVAIYTIGIGSPGGSTLIDETTNETKKDNEGNTVVSRLNEVELRSISEKANGQYLLFTNTDAVVSAINSQLSSMDQRNVTDDSLINYKSYFQYFLAAAFLFLLVEIFILERKKIKNKYAGLKTAIAIMVLITGTHVSAQSENKIIKKGNKSYKLNDFIKAADQYTKALKKNPVNPVAQFNLGNAMYKSGKNDEAVNAYENAVTQMNAPSEKTNAYYNKGVILQKDKKLPECIEAYKNALKLEPANEDARQNLQKALQQQKKEKEKQQPKEEKKKDQQEKQKQEPKPQPSKLTKQDAENKLKALMQEEKNLQDKLHKVNAASVNKPLKDW